MDLSLEQTLQHRQLASELHDILEGLKAIPGFDGFLRPKMSEPESRHAAKLGPVVLINVHASRCDALITLPDLNVIHVPLNKYSIEKAQRDQKRFCLISEGSDVGEGFESDGSDAESWIPEMLSELWFHVVKPILDALAISVSQTTDLPRIWWSPTGPLGFLPIHAAGDYKTDEPGSKIFDYVVSSYTAKGTPLPSMPPSVKPSTFKLLVVSQTPKETAFSHTQTELGNIKKHAGLFSVDYLEGSHATLERVIRGMSESTWVHFACPSHFDPHNPLKNAILLADGNLELERILAKSLPQAEFAFLTAGRTATGHIDLPNEAIHIAGGLLEVGYRSVIATISSVLDRDRGAIVDAVYAELFKNGEPDHTQAARALHHATRQMRIDGAPFRSWIPFVHIEKTGRFM